MTTFYSLFWNLMILVFLCLYFWSALLLTKNKYPFFNLAVGIFPLILLIVLALFTGYAFAVDGCETHKCNGRGVLGEAIMLVAYLSCSLILLILQIVWVLLIPSKKRLATHQYHKISESWKQKLSRIKMIIAWVIVFAPFASIFIVLFAST